MGMVARNIPDGIWKEGDLWCRICKTCHAKVTHLRFGSIRNGVDSMRCRFCKIPWNTGLTKETSEGLRTGAEKISKSTKENYANGVIKSWNTGLTKETNEILQRISENHTGKKHTKESLIKISIASSERWKRPDFREKMLPHMVEMMKKNPNTNSKPEIRVREILEQLKINFIQQFSIKYEDFDIKPIRRYYDFYLIDYGILLEIHGDYWHGFGILEENKNSTQKYVSQNDYLKAYIAKCENLKYCVIWEHETKIVEILLQKIIDTINFVQC